MNKCYYTKLRQFRSDNSAWRRVRRTARVDSQPVKVVRCNYCGFFHIIPWKVQSK